MTRINLISSPRNISTALMYSFAQRNDTMVVDEPFYGYYLKIRPLNHPGREEIVRSMEVDPAKVVDSLLSLTQASVLFIKNMAHHLIEIEDRFFRNVRNLFLIRNPEQLIASFAQVLPEPTMDDIGVRKQYEIYTGLDRDAGQPVILDSGELLKDPPGVLNKLCQALDIDFQPDMLSWEPGPRPEDGIWAKHWYANVHKTTGFQVQPTSRRSLPPELIPLSEEAKPLYELMHNESIKA